MKKLLSILAIALLAGCTPEKVEQPKDCACDKVTSVNPLNIINAPKQGFVYTTNECSGIQKRKSYIVDVPKVGDCFN
ncbi:MAG: hypothetical protein H7239_10210 [Flavobacterium sp.]|nr:hypothetical protein [Flavobacterium sp.]